MKAQPDTPGRPYTARELRGVGVVMILMGLLIAVCFHAVYRQGAAPQTVSAPWGTIQMPAISPESPMSRILKISGIGLAALGLIPLARGIRRLR